MNSLHILSIITWLPAVGGIIIIALFKKDQSTLIKRFAKLTASAQKSCFPNAAMPQAISGGTALPI